MSRPHSSKKAAVEAKEDEEKREAEETTLQKAGKTRRKARRGTRFKGRGSELKRKRKREREGAERAGVHVSFSPLTCD